MKTLTSKVCNSVVAFIFDPIIFLSMLGPLFISSGLEFMSGSLSLNGDEFKEDEVQKLKVLFNHAYFSAFRDYIIQYYTLTAATILWIARLFHVGLLHDYFSLIPKQGQTHVRSTAHPDRQGRLGVSFLFGLGLVGAMGWLVIGHGLASPKLLLVYAEHSLRPNDSILAGIIKFLPPFDSPITWLRGLLAIHVTYFINPFDLPIQAANPR